MAALGVETSAGEFSVVDVCFAGMAPGAVTGRSKGKKESTGERMEIDGEGTFVGSLVF